MKNIGFILLLLANSLQAQIQFKTFGAETGVLGAMELHEITVDNRSGQQKRLRISCELSDAISGSPILSYTFPDVMVPPGIYGCGAVQADSAAIMFHNAEAATYFYAYGQLPSGNYKLCYSAVAHYSSLVISPLCFVRTALADTATRGSPLYRNKADTPPQIPGRRGVKLFEAPPPPAADSGAVAKAREEYIQKLKQQIGRPDVKFSGTAFSSYDHSPNRGARSASATYPSSFMVTEARPRLDIYGVPIGARLLFTYNGYTRQPVFNQLNAEFDRNAFRQGLQQRLHGVLNAGQPDVVSNIPPIPGPVWGQGDATLMPFGNINAGTGSFNMADKANIKQSRYDRERLLRYRDSLEWTDPARAGEVARRMEQAEFLNTSTLLQQQDAAARKQYEDSLKKYDPDKYAGLKNLQSGKMLQEMQGNNWPGKAGDLAALMPMSNAEKFFYNVHDLSLGRAYLDYTPLSMQGIAVTGGDMAYSPGHFFVQGSGGVLDMRQSLWFQDSLAQRYSMYAGRAGYGSPGKDHLHLIYASFTQKDAIGLPADSQSLYYMPVSNRLTGAQGSFEVVKDLHISGEYMHAANSFVRQARPREEKGSFYQVIDPDPLANEALNINAVYTSRRLGTSIITAANRIGMEYRSLGNPYLRNDVLNYGINISQPLYGRKLQLRGGYRQETDNLSGIKAYTSRSCRYEAGAVLAIPSWPVLSVQYMPVLFANRATGAAPFRDYGKASSLTATAAHNISRSGKNFNSSVLYSHISNHNALSPAPGFILNTIMLAERITLDAVSGINCIGSYSVSPLAADSLQTLVIDISHYTRFFKRLDQAFGLKLNRTYRYDLLYAYCKSSFTVNRSLVASLYLYKNLNPAAAAYQNDLFQFSVAVVW